MLEVPNRPAGSGRGGAAWLKPEPIKNNAALPRGPSAHVPEIIRLIQMPAGHARSQQSMSYRKMAHRLPKVWAKFNHVGLGSVKFGPDSGESGPGLAELGLDSATFRLESGKAWFDAIKFGLESTKPNSFRPKLAQVDQNTGSARPLVGSNRPNAARLLWLTARPHRRWLWSRKGGGVGVRTYTGGVGLESPSRKEVKDSVRMKVASKGWVVAEVHLCTIRNHSTRSGRTGRSSGHCWTRWWRSAAGQAHQGGGEE